MHRKTVQERATLLGLYDYGAEDVPDGLERQHGWRFSDDQACRPGGGWALDREQVCISVDDLTEAPLVVVDVETYYGA